MQGFGGQEGQEGGEHDSDDDEQGIEVYLNGKEI
jgi:hypothetical protein